MSERHPVYPRQAERQPTDPVQHAEEGGEVVPARDSWNAR